MHSESHTSAAYREVTASAVALGIVQGVVMTAAFVYIGLKLGFGLAGSTVAAILGFALLRGAGRKLLRVADCGSILENNINQTVASGINTASSGLVFTFPALLLLGADYSIGAVLLAAVAGSFMGVVVIIPLRRQLIEIDRLKFPTGVAVATILKTPGVGARRARLLALGLVLSAVLTLCSDHRIGWVPEALPIGPALKGWLGVGERGAAALLLMGTTLSLSMANLGAGLLSGRGGLPFALGGVMAWWVVGPFAAAQGWAPPGARGEELVGAVYSTMLRPTGIGILIGGALGGVVAAYPSIRGALASLTAAARLSRSSRAPTEELSPRVLGAGLLGSLVGLAVVTLLGSAQTGELSWSVALSAAVVGAVWIALAGLIVAQATGATDISPLSGLALIAVTIMLALTGGNVVLAVTIGVAVCVATNQCADMMTDLKTGHLVGARPRRQQLVQFAVAWIGPGVALATILLLWSAGPGTAAGFGPESAACLQQEPGCLPAPQASVLQGMITSLLGGDAPLDKYVAGAVIGGGLTLLPVGGVGVLVGLAMYLPFSITLGYGVGCLLSIVAERVRGADFVSRVVVPLAAGLIVGEALTALGLALSQLVGGGG